MRYPEFLKEHGTVGFVAPSFGCSIEPYKSAFLHAQSKLRAMGFACLLGPNCYLDAGIGISNTPELCAKELTDCYISSDCDVLISCGGGELMCEDLSYIDFDAIRAAKPKYFMGYSDNTNFSFLLATLADTAAIYGPNAPAFGMQPWHPAITDAWELLTGKKRVMHNYDRWEKESLKTEEAPLLPYHTTEDFRLHTYIGKEAAGTKPVEARGRLLGGCLDCLANLVGTRFDQVAAFVKRYEEDGILWFLEACDLNVMSIRRALWQLKEAGWFLHVKGFMIGRPMHFHEDLMGMDQYDAVLGVLAGYGVPVFMDVDLGHLPPMMPLIVGSCAVVRAEGNTLSVSMECK